MDQVSLVIATLEWAREVTKPVLATQLVGGRERTETRLQTAHLGLVSCQVRVKMICLSLEKGAARMNNWQTHHSRELGAKDKQLFLSLLG